MTIKVFYKRFQEFPKGKDFIDVYTPDDCAKMIQLIMDPHFNQMNHSPFSLSEGTGVSKHFVKQYADGKQHDRVNMLNLYKINGIVKAKAANNRRLTKDFKTVRLINPIRVRKMLGQAGVKFEDLIEFTQGEFTRGKLQNNMRHQNFDFSLLVAITACYKYYVDLDLKRVSAEHTMAPNTKRARRRNDFIERYRSGYLPSVQQKTRKTS